MNLSTLRFGFIGGGKMAQALMNGLLQTKQVAIERLSVCDPVEKIQKTLKKEGYTIYQDNKDIIRNSDVIILATKPDIIEPALSDVQHVVTPKKLILSVAAGISLKSMEKQLPEGSRVARIMANIPSLVGAGACAYTLGAKCNFQEDSNIVAQILQGIGTCHYLKDENLLDVVTGLSGSGPAYIFLIIEAMADSAVMEGLPRDIAIQLAVQTCLGSAQLIKATGKNPEELRHEVCSPGGTTITGIVELEKLGLRRAIISAIQRATARSRELGDN